MPLKLTREYIKTHNEHYKCKFMFPECCYCGKNVRVGGYIDHFYPYYQEQSFHSSCRLLHIQESKKCKCPKCKRKNKL